MFDLGSFHYLTDWLSTENVGVYNKWHNTQQNYLCASFTKNLQTASLTQV